MPVLGRRYKLSTSIMYWLIIYIIKLYMASAMIFSQLNKRYCDVL